MPFSQPASCAGKNHRVQVPLVERLKQCGDILRCRYHKPIMHNGNSPCAIFVVHGGQLIVYAHVNAYSPGCGRLRFIR